MKYSELRQELTRQKKRVKELEKVEHKQRYFIDKCQSAIKKQTEEKQILKKEVTDQQEMNKKLAEGHAHMERHYDKHMELAENQIQRDKVIIEYLEEKILRSIESSF